MPYQWIKDKNFKPTRLVFHHWVKLDDGRDVDIITGELFNEGNGKSNSSLIEYDELKEIRNKVFTDPKTPKTVWRGLINQEKIESCFDKK